MEVVRACAGTAPTLRGSGCGESERHRGRCDADQGARIDDDPRQRFCADEERWSIAALPFNPHVAIAIGGGDDCDGDVVGCWRFADVTGLDVATLVVSARTELGLREALAWLATPAGSAAVAAGDFDRHAVADERSSSSCSSSAAGGAAALSLVGLTVVMPDGVRARCVKHVGENVRLEFNGGGAVVWRAQNEVSFLSRAREGQLE